MAEKKEKKYVSDNPQLMAEWNWEKNNELGFDPSQMTCGMNKKVWWKCAKGHEWEASIAHRSCGKGCPYCSNRKILRGYNDLATVHPEIALEWNYEKNNGVTPYEVSPASGKKYWWKCKNGHEWYTSILNRHDGSNCLICTNQQVLSGYNDLATTHPWLAEEWNYERNGKLLPTGVVAGSAKKVWWLGKCGHEWQAVIGSRSVGRGCPICAKRSRVSFPEKCIYFYIKKIYTDAEENVRMDEMGGLELDIYIPSINVAIEYDGMHWHKNLEKDLKKDDICQKNGITLYRIRESNCEMVDTERWIKLQNEGTAVLKNAIYTLIERIRGENIEIDIDINIERDRIQILETMINSIKDHSLAAVFPDLAKQWHSSKNGRLKPNQFSYLSREIVWWIGECGHEWDASIYSRVNGGGCPYCSNNRVLSGFNDLATTHPHLIKEWDYNKNEISPDEIFAGSEVLVWWKCSKGHEWQTYPYKRKTGEGCPFCSNRRLLLGYNDLATVNPTLSQEWNYARNECTPTDVVAGSNKVVWWKCSTCGYEWRASINARNKGRGCKKCFDAQIGKTLANIKLKNNGSLLERYTELSKEWNYQKNITETPQTITVMSNKKVWWKCKEGHEWEARVSSRTKGSLCPYCSGRHAIKGKNDLQTVNPLLAKEWNYEKNNGLTPADVLPNSRRKVWWKCSEGHEWQATVNNRSNGRGCPICAKEKRKANKNNTD